jgi:hypothetical protein
MFLFFPFFLSRIKKGSRYHCTPHLWNNLRFDLCSVATTPRKSAKRLKCTILSPITPSAYETLLVDTSQRPICRDDVYRVLNMVHISFLGILGTGTYIYPSSWDLNFFTER